MCLLIAHSVKLILFNIFPLAVTPEPFTLDCEGATDNANNIIFDCTSNTDLTTVDLQCFLNDVQQTTCKSCLPLNHYPSFDSNTIDLQCCIGLCNKFCANFCRNITIHETLSNFGFENFSMYALLAVIAQRYLLLRTIPYLGLQSVCIGGLVTAV